MEKQIKTEISKNGLPCLWESGGSWSNTGKATLISDQYGRPKKPIYIRLRGSLCCSEHALFAINKNDLICKINHYREDFEIFLYCVDYFTWTNEKNEKKCYANLILYNKFDKGEWDKTLNEIYHSFIQAAKNKVTDYHCRRVFFQKNI